MYIFLFFKSSILLYTYLIMLIMKTFLVMGFGALSIIRLRKKSNYNILKQFVLVDFAVINV